MVWRPQVDTSQKIDSSWTPQISDFVIWHVNDTWKYDFFLLHPYVDHMFIICWSYIYIYMYSIYIYISSSRYLSKSIVLRVPRRPKSLHLDQGASVGLMVSTTKTMVFLFKDLATWFLKKQKHKLICYPQQLGRSWKEFVPEPSGTLSAMCNGHLSNSVCYLHQNHPQLHRLLNQNLPEPHQPSAPKQSGSLSAFCQYASELSTNLACCLHRNLMSHPEPSRTLSAPRRSKPHQPSAPEPSGTSSAICTGTLRNLISHLHRNPPEFHQPSAPEPSRNLISHLHRNPPEPCLLSAPEPSGTSSAICTGTLRNFISFLRHNPPELHQPSAPEPSGTSSAICTGTRRNLVCYLHRTELSGTSSALFSTGTLRNLISCTGTLWKFISHLHRNPPEPHQPSAPEPSGTFSGTWCCNCTGSHQSYSGLKTP